MICHGMLRELIKLRVKKNKVRRFGQNIIDVIFVIICPRLYLYYYENTFSLLNTLLFCTLRWARDCPTGETQ